MKNRNEIIKDLEDQILPRLQEIKILQGEVDTLQKSIISLRELGGEAVPEAKEVVKENNLSEYPNYPVMGTLMQKYRYLEDITLKVWRKRDMEALIHQIEGKKQATKTLRAATSQTHYYIKRNELIRIRYGNKSSYSFFTTRSEWVGRENNNGNISFHILTQHEPEQTLLIGLSEELRKPHNISWSGIN